MKFLVLVTMITVGLAAEGGDWTYGDQSTWEGDCNTGTRESPIEVTGADKIVAYKDRIIFPAKATVKVETAGLKTVQLDFVNPPTFQMPSSWPVGHTKGLQALQLHMHWGREGEAGSEHFFMGKQFDGEAHLVCRNLDQEDDTAGDAYAVFGVLLEIDDSSIDVGSLNLLNILKSETTDFDFTQVYGEIRLSNMFTYEGGLTTPGCDEKVLWHLCSVPLKVSTLLMSKLRELGGSDYELNYRDLQPLNGRKITHRFLGMPYSTPEEEEPQQCDVDCYAAEQNCRWTNTAVESFPSILLLLIALFSLF